MSSLTGKVAIITGGGKGTGLGIARAFVKEGIAVAITGRGAESLKAAQVELEELVPGARVLTVQADNKDHGAAADVVSRTVAEFGRVDILINNAQEFRTNIALEDMTWDDVISTYESGVFATWRFMVAALPHLKEARGTIINMGSGAGTNSIAKHGAYGPNKEAIRGLSRIAAREWGPHDITVNVINPYVASAESERVEREQPEFIKALQAQLPLGRIGDAELNVGGLALFLARPEGRYLTGLSIDVDGGGSIRP
ncbi:SDR family oxidoreductase [Pseudonocardia halophobica]|uniref:Short-chain dehydrogenase n=1 Tax=Pseudonocardia halophobica TaxID=29401 RepID=A0A9W6L005_9PSEU|nr:SDR family oxidoreductase [Pseudonocardia halophobica]GLL10518.1 short-chain dehydrogenase [Pseudonocardia halophobica]